MFDCERKPTSKVAQLAIQGQRFNKLSLASISVTLLFECWLLKFTFTFQLWPSLRINTCFCVQPFSAFETGFDYTRFCAKDRRIVFDHWRSSNKFRSSTFETPFEPSAKTLGQPKSAKMMLGGTSSELNPNSAWLNSRGMWLSYCFGVLLIHFALLSFPFLTIAWTWTLTNLIHNTVFICCYFTCACTSLYTYSIKCYSQYNVLIDRSFWHHPIRSTSFVSLLVDAAVVYFTNLLISLITRNQLLFSNRSLNRAESCSL